MWSIATDSSIQYGWCSSLTVPWGPLPARRSVSVWKRPSRMFAPSRKPRMYAAQKTPGSVRGSWRYARQDSSNCAPLTGVADISATGVVHRIIAASNSSDLIMGHYHQPSTACGLRLATPAAGSCAGARPGRVSTEGFSRVAVSSQASTWRRASDRFRPAARLSL